MNKKTFDELCASYLGENVPPTPTAPKLVTTPSPNQPAQPTTNNQQPPAQSQGQQNPQIKDEELLKLLQQKLQDEKFKQQLAQMLNNPQQPNATNQPA